MRCADTSTTRELANQLLAYEELEPRSGMHAAVRVCDKLRRPLATVAGTAGYHSLLRRALTLAKGESPVLSMWEVSADDALQVPQSEKAPSGAPLIANLLGLVMTLVGKSLTLRLLHDVWPLLTDYQAEVARKEAK